MTSQGIRRPLWRCLPSSSVPSKIRASAFLPFLFAVLVASPASAKFLAVAETPEWVEFLWQPDPALDSASQIGADLPAIWVALPPGGEATLSYEVDGRETVPNLLSGADTALLTETWQEEPVRMEVPTWIRDRYGAQVVVRPWELRPDGAWSVVTGVRIQVSIGDPGEPRRAAPGRDPFERLYDQVFINAESSRNWHRVTRPAPRPQGQEYFSNGTDWVRVRVREEGIHEITGSDLERVGVSPGSIDPASLRMFSGAQLPLPEDLGVEEVPGWMEEISIAVEEIGGPDGTFDPGDRIVFLGHAADDWYVNKGTAPTANERFARDPYSNDSVYWLTWGGSFAGNPRRIDEVDGTGASGPFVNQVRDRIHLEEDRIYSPRQKESGPTAAHWEQYWWRELQTTEAESRQSVTVQIPDPDPDEPIDVFARFWGENDPRSGATPPPPDHDLRLELNDHVLQRMQWEGRTRQDVSVSGSWLVPGDEQVFRLVGIPHLDPTIQRFDIVLLAFIEVAYTRNLNLRDGRIEFFAGGLSGPQPLEIRGLEAGLGTSEVWILNTDDPFHPTRVGGEITAGSVRFRADLSAIGTSRFVVSESDRFLSPTLEPRRVPEGGYLRERTDPAQMVIVTHSSLLGEAEALASYRRENFPDREEADISVVDVEEIYDEFSFGRKDPTAIRNFLQYIKERWTGGVPADGPAFVLLLGDAHRDHRSLVTEGNPDLVPSYTGYYDPRLASSIYDPRFSSDDYFCLFDGPADSGMDMYVGRLPAQTAAQARVLVEKVMIYEQESDPGDWRNQITLVADDVCQGTSRDDLGFLHMRQTETLAHGFLPETLEQRKIYLYEYGAECIFTNKPEAASDLSRAMNEGTLVVNYTGHGGETQIADERVFEVSNVGNLTNRNRLFFLLTASCSIGKFDTSAESLAEALMRHGNGGAIAIFAASAVAFSSPNALVNQLFYLEAFPEGCGGCSRPIGESAAIAKLRLNHSGLDQRRYALHGDPAVALLAPGSEISLSLTNPRTGEAVESELRRGSPLDLAGEVRALDGSLREDFEGTASIRIFDSETVRQPIPGNELFDYTLPGAPIYRGTAQVTEGRFSSRFVVPASLRTGLRGDAQIYVYAEDGQDDAAGAMPELVVPEALPEPSTDVSGPTIEFAFVEPGDVIRPEAAYTASLFDSSGINMTGLAPSRSAVLRLEQNGVTIFAEDLSSRIEFGDDFRSATLSHRLPGNLPEGAYELEMRAYDNLNFGSSVRTSFVLANSGVLGFSVGRVFNMPNPTERGTHFFAEIPEDADVEVDLFTLSGRRIRSLGPVRLRAGGAGSTGIEWDGVDDDGDRPANGVYFYKVTATSVRTGEAHSAIGRLVVSR